jgi:hypothetical protein
MDYPGHPLRDAAHALPLEDFIPKARAEFLPQFDHVTIDYKVGVTRLYRFEELAAAWGDIGARLGIAAGPIGHKNASGSAPMAVTDAARRLVEELYAMDCELYESVPRV